MLLIHAYTAAARQTATVVVCESRRARIIAVGKGWLLLKSNFFPDFKPSLSCSSSSNIISSLSRFHSASPHLFKVVAQAYILTLFYLFLNRSRHRTSHSTGEWVSERENSMGPDDVTETTAFILVHSLTLPPHVHYTVFLRWGNGTVDFQNGSLVHRIIYILCPAAAFCFPPLHIIVVAARQWQNRRKLCVLGDDQTHTHTTPRLR
jgi:hypothetical protein